MGQHSYSPAELADMDQRHATIRSTVEELAVVLKEHNTKCQTPMCDMALMVRQMIQATVQANDLLPVCEIAAFLLCERAKQDDPTFRKDFPQP